MQYKHGYIIDNEELRYMNVGDLEATLLRLKKDMYLSDHDKRDLMAIYLEERKSVLDKAFCYTKGNIGRIENMNSLFKAQTSEVMRLAFRIYQDEMAEREKSHDIYNSLEVATQLVVPSEEPDKDSDNEAIWDILSSLSFNKNLDAFNILASLDATFSSNDERPIDQKINQVLYGEDDVAQARSWGYEMMGFDREKFKHICIVWPFHNLYDFCKFSMQDILKIKKFNYKITMKYENV